MVSKNRAGTERGTETSDGIKQVVSAERVKRMVSNSKEVASDDAASVDGG
jgi:hypothetical protein